jgi:pimeloyl-ACP methyl ester carboxylesterase
MDTGDPCFLGIDPDIYQMPLFGKYIQSGDERICATTNWSPFPPEMFDIDFMRNFWAFGMNSAQQAETEAASFFFVTTHWGPPAAPAADLAEVATPSAFSDEVFSSLDARTTRIEFEVPKTDFERLGWTATHVPLSIPADPNPDVPLKLRGWYIKGDGVSAHDEGDSDADGAEGRVEHPLIVFSSGFPYSIAFDAPVGGVEVGRQMRKTITYLVAKGFDVLFFDKRSHGYSEGLLDGMGEDIFRVLDQLEHGQIVEQGITLTLTMIAPDGRRLRGAAAAAENLLGEGYTARTKPIVLRGFSYGSSQLQKAMAMNYSNLPVEYRFTRDAGGNVVVDEARMPPGNRGYNFKGIIAISGFQGSLKYETAPFFLALDALASTIGHNGGVLKSSVYESMDRWPAFLGLYSTNDFETADGAIDVFNERLRGFKDIKMVTGYHFGLASAEVDTYFAQESASFAKRTIFEAAPTANERTTSYAEEVCDSERVIMDPVTQSIVDVPSEEIRKANRKVDRFIGKWIEKQ